MEITQRTKIFQEVEAEQEERTSVKKSLRALVCLSEIESCLLSRQTLLLVEGGLLSASGLPIYWNKWSDND
ncbi:hypothetical protein J6590_013823 [Homalodisca vitripennis]|nr:hypothetical protein J6590_013823 [Homalodisca vitripennis]